MKIFKSVRLVSIVLVLLVVSSISAFAANEKRVDLDGSNYFTISGYDTETPREWDNPNGPEKFIFTDYQSESPVTITYQVDESILTVMLFSFETKSPNPDPHTFTIQQTTEVETKIRTIENPGKQYWSMTGKYLDYITFSNPGYYHVNIKQTDGKLHNLFVHIYKEGELPTTATPDAKPGEPAEAATPDVKPSEPAPTTAPNAKPTEAAPTTVPNAKPTDSKSASVVLNGKAVTLTPAAQVRNGTTFVPLRGVFENMSAKIGWDQKKQLVTITYEGKVVELTIGSKTAKVDGEEFTLTVAPFVDKNYTFVPLRFISQSIGATVSWDQATATAGIQTK